jgi:hypothetical protein
MLARASRPGLHLDMDCIRVAQRQSLGWEGILMPKMHWRSIFRRHSEAGWPLGIAVPAGSGM